MEVHQRGVRTVGLGFGQIMDCGVRKHKRFCPQGPTPSTQTSSSLNGFKLGAKASLSYFLHHYNTDNLTSDSEQGQGIQSNSTWSSDSYLIQISLAQPNFCL